MGVNLVIDTNIYSAWVRNDARVVDLLRGTQTIFVPAPVIGELLFGFRQGSRLRSNTAALNSFVSDRHVRVVPVSMKTADSYARIMAILRRTGRPIPPNDVWIAASALERRLPLLSFDRHFAAVPGIAWIDPART